MKNSPKLLTSLISCLIMLVLASCSQNDITITVNTTPLRVNPGDTVKVEIRVSHAGGFASGQLNAVLLKPILGSFELILEKDQNKPGFYKGEVILSGDTPEGL
ncbi:MAG: hypothetical protein U9Q21_01170, partial [Candidatus Auribacterota bacterium]|nr:hypothetical protein [Candidatus Auribacterota bacterium]